jgi:TonB family protein
MRILALLLGTLLSAAEPAPRGDLTRPPELIEFVPADYPPDAEAAGVQGSVLLTIVIGEAGEVVQAEVVEPGPHPGFAPAALHAVQQFRFLPAEIDGAPAAVEISYRYDFFLRKVEPPASADAPVVLEGRILERGTRTPIAGATVEAQGVATESGADGRFALRGVAPGDVIVRIVSPEHVPLSATERLVEGEVREVEYRLARRHYDPYEAVVRGERSRREITVRTLTTEEVRTMAGTQGDTLKVLQSLPGVARSPFGIGLLVVRGSEPNETVVYVDGVPIPQLFHFGGITSVVNGDVVEAIDFLPGNFSSRWGRALGGTVDLRTREPLRAWHGAAQLDVFDGRVEVEGPVGKKGSAYASLRRSWIDALLAVALPRMDRETANDMRVAPRYWDWQAKLTLPVLGGEGSVFALGSDDRLEFVRPSDRPGRPTFFLSTVFWRVGARHRLPVGRAATNDVVVAAGRDSFDVLQGTSFGLLTEILTVSARDTLALRLSRNLVLAGGVDALARRIDYSVYAAPPQPAGSVLDDPFPDGPATVGEAARGWWVAPAAFVEADWRPRRALRFVGGLRADVESRFGRAKLWVDPRVSAFLDVARRTTLMAAAGLFGSAPDAQQTSPTFGNADLDPERGLHLSLGVRHELPWATRLELTGFHKELWSLVVPTKAVDEDGRLLRLSNEGRGRTVGMEMLLRRELARGLFGWFAWTWSQSLRRDDPTDPSYPSWRPFLLDQTHVVALVMSYRLRDDWILGTRVRGVTGNPYTPAVGAVLDADNGRVRCLPGAPLSRRLPGFFQADARLDKRFVFESWMLSAYLDVQNVTNRENAEFRFRNFDCTTDTPLPSIPILPAVGVRAEW